jgi:hypothetical protein
MLAATRLANVSRSASRRTRPRTAPARRGRCTGTARLDARDDIRRPPGMGLGDRGNLPLRGRQTNRACDAMAEKSRRLARNSKLGDAAAIISLGNPDELSGAI